MCLLVSFNDLDLSFLNFILSLHFSFSCKFETPRGFRSPMKEILNEIKNIGNPTTNNINKMSILLSPYLPNFNTRTYLEISVDRLIFQDGNFGLEPGDAVSKGRRINQF